MELDREIAVRQKLVKTAKDTVAVVMFVVETLASPFRGTGMTASQPQKDDPLRIQCAAIENQLRIGGDLALVVKAREDAKAYASKECELLRVKRDTCEALKHRTILLSIATKCHDLVQDCVSAEAKARATDCMKTLTYWKEALAGEYRSLKDAEYAAVGAANEAWKTASKFQRPGSISDLNALQNSTQAVSRLKEALTTAIGPESNTLRGPAGAADAIHTHHVAESHAGPVANADTAEQQQSRAALCAVTANTLKLSLNDLLDMSGMNLFNTGNGWTNISGAPLSAMVQRYQLVIDGTASDTVQVAGGSDWTSAGTASSSISGAAQSYNVWNHNTSAAQLLIDVDIIRQAVL
jgi:hypothetical protein